MTNVRKEKFVELHAHLDGAITVEIARKLADCQGMELRTLDDELLDMISVPPTCESLTEFLDCFKFPLSLLQTREAISEAVRLVLKDMAITGVVYAELRFAPQLHTEKGLTQEEVIEAALDGVEKSMNNSDIRANLILCCMRGENNHDENMETLRLAEKYVHSKKRVAAIDLAGAEAIYPTEDYSDLFEAAREKNVPFTIHAGEAAGAESVRVAVDMGAARIGHGIRACTDEELLGIIKNRRICLEMCPTSNRITRAVSDMADYPLRKYIDMGIKVTINTDDSAIVRTDIANEFQCAIQLANLTDSEVNRLKINAVEASFASNEDKDWMRRLINV
jgi:adenosine deaminase